MDKLKKNIPGLLIVLLGIALVFFHYGNYWSAHWLSKWSLLMGFFSLYMGYMVGRQAHWVFAPITAYTLLSAAYIGTWPQNLYVGQADPISLLALEKNSLYSYLCVVAMVTFFISFKRSHLVFTQTLLAAICFIFIASTLLFKVGGPPDSGLWGNPSMIGCLIVATLPFLMGIIQKESWIYFCMSAAGIAIYFTQASVPIGLFIFTLAAWKLSADMFKLQPVLEAVPFLTVLCFILGFFKVGHPLFFTSGRTHTWAMAWHWWIGEAPHVFGTGLGTTQILMPLIQAHVEPHTTNWWLWLHNDWFQVLFELGWVGLTFTIPAWFYLLFKAKDRPVLFSSLSAFSAMALFNYPLRMPIHCFCLLLVCCLIMAKPDEQTRTLV